MCTTVHAHRRTRVLEYMREYMLYDHVLYTAQEYDAAQARVGSASLLLLLNEFSEFVRAAGYP